MSLNRAARRSGLIGTLLSLTFATFLVTGTSAQGQVCECYDNYRTVSVNRTPVRRAVRKYGKTKRATVARRANIARPTYQTVYIPVREVAYTPRYVEYVEDDCDDIRYTAAGRVIVTDRIYPVAGSRYYVNTHNGNGKRVYAANNYAKARVVYEGNHSQLDVDSDYFSTERIAADYGYRDGYSDGHEVGMEREIYNPHKEGDFRNGTNGYEGHFGAKWLYKQAYRDAYLKGYDAGFRSVAQRSTYRAVRW